MLTHPFLKPPPFLFAAACGLIAAESRGSTAAPQTPTIEAAPSGRYLQWSDGTPFFIHADTAWTLPHDYQDEEVIAYLDQRVAQGFNTIQMSAIFGRIGQPKDESFHERAFVGGDLTKPVDAYWRHVDWVVEQTTRRGLVAILNPIWKRHFNLLLQASGPEKCRAFGRWFAQRYRQNPRVLYFVGGDERAEPVRNELDAMGRGIQDVYAGRALVAFHNEADYSSRDAFPDATWITLNWTYAYAPPYRKKYPYEANWADWAKHPAMPIQFGEGFYDFGAETRAGANHQRARWADRFALRRQAWWAGVLSGATGHAYGAEAIWLHNRDSQTWQMAVAYESGQDMRRLKAFVDAIPWWTLQPDHRQAFLVGGFGEWRTDDFALAAVSQDRSLAVVYTPVAHALELRLDELRPGNITAQWFDPSSGEYRGLDSALFAKRGTITLPSPAANATGDADHVLVVRVDR